MVHRGKLDKPAPNSVAEHDQVSEVYHIIDGSATLMLGPDITNRQRRPATQLTVREFNGPGNNGSDIRNGVSYDLKAGDVVVIPAGTGHWFTEDRRPHRLSDGADRSRQGDAAQGRSRIEGVPVEAGAARQLKGPWCLVLGPWSVPGPRTFFSVSASSTSALYALATQIIGGVILTPWFSFPALGNVRPMRDDHRVAGRARVRPAPAAPLHRQQRRHGISLGSERLAAGRSPSSSLPSG